MSSHAPLSQILIMMSSVAANEIREYWREFIQIYKSFPALWKIKSEAYKNRKLKDQCYKVLVKKLKEIEPHADRYMVRKKVNILRSNFRRELKKIHTIKALNSTDTYKPTLWYFNDMLFLSNQEELQNAEETAHTAEIEYSVNAQNETIADPFEDFDCKSEVLSETSIVSKDVELIEDKCDNSPVKSMDDIDIQGKLWASEFRKLDSEQQLFAKKAIDDILFEGRMMGLKRSSVQINGARNNN